MAHFTQQEIDEISRRLAAKAVKDSQFPTANAIRMEDFVAIVQNEKNKKITVEGLYSDISEYIYENYVILLDILVENGGTILHKNGSADLQAQVLIGGVDMTSQVAPEAFSWTRSSDSQALDNVWNSLHEGVGSRIHVEPADVNRACTFYCSIPIESLKTLNI